MIAEGLDAVDPAVVQRESLRERLSEVRARTLWLLDQVPDDFLRRRVHDFYSPIGWHFGHVGRTEEYWVIGKALNQPLLDDRLTFLFADLPDNPKDNRVNIPDRAGIVDYLACTRARVEAALASADLIGGNPLLGEGYAWDFAIQHECQHQETICEMLQLIHKQIPQSLDAPRDFASSHRTEMVDIPGGAFVMGTDDRHVYDNEQSAHEVRVAPFRLAATPVTTREWGEFIGCGGYVRPELWTAEGWAWVQQARPTAPEYWVPAEDGTHPARGQYASPRRYDYVGPRGLRAIHPDEPVCGVNWFEASAFATWQRKRLPTEQEWEYAACAGAPVRYPWGDGPATDALACHGIASWGPSPVGGRAPNPFGLHDMAGNVWEWTSDPFLPYPGFTAYPYDGYSKDHMKGAHRVCRGGSWATSPGILRRTFRNWYVPHLSAGLPWRPACGIVIGGRAAQIR